MNIWLPKNCFTLVISMVLFACSAMAQSACRQATASSTARHEAFTVFSISLPSRSGSVAAQALIPNSSRKRAGAVVFSLSRLVGSEPKQIVDMLPIAADLATAGRPTIIIQRTLTWPRVDKSVGQMQEDVLCAEQWLSAHAAIKPDNWDFVGPEADNPTFDQLHAVGDNNSMIFYWGFPLGGLNENKNTDQVLRDGSINIAALTAHE
jgi:hypothetical protein